MFFIQVPNLAGKKIRKWFVAIADLLKIFLFSQQRNFTATTKKIIHTYCFEIGNVSNNSNLEFFLELAVGQLTTASLKIFIKDL